MLKIRVMIINFRVFRRRKGSFKLTMNMEETVV